MKLVFEFTKTGDMIFISHLDLSRLLLRVLRMSGLRPAYSRGFNPHPKMSFALPLALGLHSTCELLEFETETDTGVFNITGTKQLFKTDKESGTATGNRASANPAGVIGLVNERLPEGIRVTACREKPDDVPKSYASYVTAARYEFLCNGVTDAPGKLAAFFMKESVVIKKQDKKTGEETRQEVRPLMLDYRIIKDLRGSMLAEATLSAAPGRTLGPAAFFGAFYEASGIPAEGVLPVITRTAILGADGAPLSGCYA